MWLPGNLNSKFTYSLITKQCGNVKADINMLFQLDSWYYELITVMTGNADLEPVTSSVQRLSKHSKQLSRFTDTSSSLADPNSQINYDNIDYNII